VKKIILILVLMSTLANAGFLKHFAIIGAGIAIGHAADKAINYGVEKYKNRSENNTSVRNNLR
jgi:hypothetical protein